MANIVEGKFPGEFIYSQLPGEQSKDNVTLASGQKVNAGDVAALNVAGNKYVQLVPGAGDSTGVAAALVYANTDASATGTNADTACVIVSRGAEVNAGEIGWNGASGAQITAGIAALATKGILVRAAV